MRGQGVVKVLRFMLACRIMRIPWVAVLIGWLLCATAAPVVAVEMVDDPKGFQDIPWGASLDDRPFLKRTYTSDTISEYQPKDARPLLESIPVAAMKFSSLEGKFARVVVRYQGEALHKRILSYLERRYGPLDKTPGQMVRGLNQQYNWRGPETEINLTYEGQSERGFVFFDSRTLAPRFNDGITDSSE